MPVPCNNSRLLRTQTSLEGLAVGDAFGAWLSSFSLDRHHHYFEVRQLPTAADSPWRFTDDTQMALSLIEVLLHEERIDQDRLVESFVAHYDPSRGYGASIHRMLREVHAGGRSWRELVRCQFGGHGSYGNGAAMRVAPLGAFFADNMDLLVEQARLSAEVTHTHTEAISGAVAVTTASALAWHARRANQRLTRAEFIEYLLPFVPEGDVCSKLHSARDLSPNTSVEAVAQILGSGYQISAQDTVPYVIWCAGQFLDNYEKALWQTASGLGDVDTTCAMVGGIVVLYTGIEQIPAEWRNHHEAFPSWPFKARQFPPSADHGKGGNWRIHYALHSEREEATCHNKRAQKLIMCQICPSSSIVTSTLLCVFGLIRLAWSRMAMHEKRMKTLAGRRIASTNVRMSSILRSLTEPQKLYSQAFGQGCSSKPITWGS